MQSTPFRLCRNAPPQTFKNFECILIDDGSPDNCPAICDEYTAKDSRIQVIHQKNAGVSAARNAGLAAARGNWIGFVDSDDWIEPNTYELAYNTAKEKNADLVQWNISYEKDGRKIRNPVFRNEGYFSVADDATYFQESVWHKLILKKLICDNNITFPIGIRWTEDTLFSCRCYTEGKHCYSLENMMYHYEQHEGSSCHNISKETLFKCAEIVKLMQNIIRTKDLEKTGWKKVVLGVKKEIKYRLIFSLEKPDFNLYHITYPECNKSMIKFKGNSKFVFLLLYFHLDFMAAIIINEWKLFRKHRINR